MSVLLYVLVLTSTTTLTTGISRVEIVSQNDKYQPDAAKWFRRIYLKPGADGRKTLDTPTWWLDRYLRNTDDNSPEVIVNPPVPDYDEISIRRRPQFIGKRKGNAIDDDDDDAVVIFRNDNLPKTPEEYSTEEVGRLQTIAQDKSLLQKHRLPKTESVDISMYMPPQDEFIQTPSKKKRAPSYLGKISALYIGKRQRPYIGKRAHSYMGKRLPSYLGKRARSYLGKRIPSYLGKRVRSYIREMIKRARSYLGKRTQLPRKASSYIGKRTRPWHMAKRSLSDFKERKAADTNNELRSYPAKRARSYLGKRSSHIPKWNNPSILHQQLSDDLSRNPSSYSNSYRHKRRHSSSVNDKHAPGRTRD